MFFIFWLIIHIPVSQVPYDLYFSFGYAGMHSQHQWNKITATENSNTKKYSCPTQIYAWHLTKTRLPSQNQPLEIEAEYLKLLRTSQALGNQSSTSSISSIEQLPLLTNRRAMGGILLLQILHSFWCRRPVWDFEVPSKQEWWLCSQKYKKGLKIFQSKYLILLIFGSWPPAFSFLFHISLSINNIFPNIHTQKSQHKGGLASNLNKKVILNRMAFYSPENNISRLQ